MAILDLTHDLDATTVFNIGIASDTTTNTDGVDMSDYDGGFMFTIFTGSYNDGTYVLTIQDSPDNSVWTDIPAEKLIDPAGAGSLTVFSEIAPGVQLPRIGAFSTNKFIRGQIVSTSVSAGAFLSVNVIRRPEQKPAD